MSAIFHRDPTRVPPVVARGEGCYIVDQAGKRYLDASGGAAVSCLGHGDPDVTRAVQTQLDNIAFAHSGFFTSSPAEQLAATLVADAPDGIDKVLFVSGGSEAVEAGLKLARQYFVERGESDRRYFIARRQSYHGNTLGALSVGGNMARRGLYDPLLMKTAHIDPCFAYRFKPDDESEAEYGIRVADQLETEIERLGAENVAAFVAETVVGATAGAVPAVAGYFKRIREICDRHGVLLMLDEVMCGMGRTGYMFACEEEAVRPDIIAIAKGLGAGYQPIGAMLCSADIFDTIRAGSGFFQHGHTYMAHPAACAAALAVQQKIITGGLLAKVRSRGEQLDALLHERFGNHPHIGDIRGRGLFRALELVADRQSKAPFPAALKLHGRIKSRAFEDGLICYPMGGTIDGIEGDHVLLAPPFIIGDGELAELVDKLAGAVAGALAEIDTADG